VKEKQFFFMVPNFNCQYALTIFRIWRSKCIRKIQIWI